MKSVLSLFAIIILITNCVSIERTTQLTQAVFEAENQRFERTVAADTAALRRSLHADLLYIHSNGLEEDIEAHLTNVGVAKIDYQSFTPLQPNSLLLKSNLAFLDGLVKVDGLYDGYPFSVNLRYTSTYEKVEGHWQLLRWQSTKIEED